MLAKGLNVFLFLISVGYCFTEIGLYMSIPLLTSFLTFFHFKLNNIPKDAEAQPANALKVSSIMFNIILFLIALALTLSFLDPKHPSPYKSLGMPLFAFMGIVYPISIFNLYKLFQKNG